MNNGLVTSNQGMQQTTYRDELHINKVGNGFLVKPSMDGYSSFQWEKMFVFNTAAKLAEYIQDYYTVKKGA